MPEILTESFCERCGTRYTFESSAPRTHRLKGVKVLSRGLRNFVMSDDTSLDEAMAAARSDTDREVTSQQLDAFHKAFNFCMQCRQYTCANCWNDAEGRCLTCAPHVGHDILEAPFPDLAASPQMDLGEAAVGNGTNGHHDPALDALAWPTSDLLRDATADATGLDDVDALDAGDEIEAIDAVARLAALGAVTHDEATDAVAADLEAETEDALASATAEDAPDIAEEALAAIPDARAARDDDTIATSPREALAPAADEPIAASADDALAWAAEEPPATTPEAPAGSADLGTVETAAAAAIAADSATMDDEAATVSEPAAAAASEPTGDIDRRAAAAAAATASLLRSFRPGQSLDDALEAYERDQEAGSTAAAALGSAAVARPGEPEAEPMAAEPVAAQPMAAEPVAAQPMAAEPVAAELATTTDEPVEGPVEADQDHHLAAAAAAAAAIVTPEPDGFRPVDHVEQPTWQIVAPDPGAVHPAVTTDAPTSVPPIAASAEPQWPAQPQWPTPGQSTGLPFLGRPAAASGGMDALWAESARAVASVPGAPSPAGAAKATGGVQPCVSCGLSLSATARFCRRCGSRQG